MPAKPRTPPRPPRETHPTPNLTADQLQAIAHAIADPRRFAILQQIARQDRLPCTALSEHSTLAPATISHHTKTLYEAGLIDMTRAGRGVTLALRRDTWNSYLQQLAEL